MNFRMGQTIQYQLDGDKKFRLGRIDGVGHHSVRVNSSDGVREAVRLDQVRFVFQREIHTVIWIEDNKPHSLSTFDFQVADRLFAETEDREVYADMITRTANFWQEVNPAS